MSDDTIQITVDGKQLDARRGQMLIEVTDAAGIDVPRLCYHKKLSVAANCRMCLVEVEKAPTFAGLRDSGHARPGRTHRIESGT